MNDISQDEIITRFIFDRKRDYFSGANKTVQFKSFMPPPDPEDRSKYSPDLSVCRISILSGNGVMPSDKIWKIGSENRYRTTTFKNTKSPSRSSDKQCLREQSQSYLRPATV